MSIQRRLTGSGLADRLDSLKLLLVVQFATRLRGGVIAPILALFIRRQGLTVAQIGLLGTAGMLGWFIFEPLVGLVADRVRKKNLTIFAIATSSLLIAAYPFASSIWHFALLAFARASVMSAYAVSVKALQAELLPVSGRGRAYGRYMSAITLGGIVGPLFGGYLSEAVSRTLPFYLSAGVGLVALAALVLMSYDERETIREKDDFGSTNWGEIFTGPFLSILLIRMLFMVNLVFRQNTLPIYLNESPRFRATETQIGAYMGIMSLASAVSQAFLGDLADRVGTKVIIASSVFLSGLSYLGLASLGGTVALYAIGGLQGVTFSAADLGMMLYCMSVIPEGRTGVVMGFYSESENVGGMIAAPSIGYLYDGLGPAFTVNTVAVVLIASAVLPLLLIRKTGDIEADKS